MADWTPGIPEEEFHHRQPRCGLITKAEVRVLSLAKLRIREESVIWDIGAGSGSVAIEAALIAGRGSVWAIEKNAEDMENIARNVGKFGVTNVTAMNAVAPERLDEFPDPDAVFIGGSGGEMREILGIVGKRLRTGGRVVVNAITLDSSYEAVSFMKELGFEVETTLVQIARSKALLGKTSFEALNPIYIITGKRPGE